MTDETSARCNFRFFSSWSGGKDSCLALYRMIRAGHDCVSLCTMLDETGEHSRSHGLSPATLRAQASALGFPILMTPASWKDYEGQFKSAVAALKAQGVQHGVFGDIDLEPHREWVERVCRELGLRAHQPLWQGGRRELICEFVVAGFKALIVVVDGKQLTAEFLGREFDEALIDELEARGVDACGENGEFHTFVYDGPLFKHAVEFVKGVAFNIDHYRVLPVLSSSDSKESTL